MRDRVNVRKTGPGEWTITRPRLGFGGPEVLTARTGALALRLVRQLDKLRGGHGEDEGRAYNVADGLATIPRWDPAPFRFWPKPW